MTSPLRLAAAAAAILVCAAPALAAPTLRAEAVVTGELVTVGDLFDGAEGLEGVALFRAPDPGQTGPLPAASAIAAARGAGVIGAEAGEVREVFVTRASRELTVSELEGLVLARAATEYGVDVDVIEVTFDDPKSLHAAPDAKGAAGVTRFAIDPRTGRFEASIGFAGRSRGDETLRVSGTALETVEVAVLRRPFARGDILSAAEMKTERRPKIQIGEVIAPAEAVGLAARRSLREGQPLRAIDLTRPQHVDRGAFVTLVYAGAGVSLSLKAKALAAGAQGDVIPVQNIQSKRTVNGVVTGPSEVTVTAATTTVARR